MSTARLSAVVGLLLLLAVPAPAMGASRTFQTPSKKIACRYDSSPSPRLRCDALFLNDVAFHLTRTGKGKRRTATDTIANPKARVLAYGKSLELGPFTCASRRSELKCKTRSNGHGFGISRERQRLF